MAETKECTDLGFDVQRYKKVRPWLIKIFIRTVNGRHRRTWKIRKKEVTGDLLKYDVAARPDIDGDFASGERIRELRKHFTPLQDSIFMLQITGRNNQEIAELLGVKGTKVENEIKSARKRLRLISHLLLA